MKMDNAAEALNRLSGQAALCDRLVVESPSTAPSGRISTNANQKSAVYEILVQKYAAAP